MHTRSLPAMPRFALQDALGATQSTQDPPFFPMAGKNRAATILGG